MNYLLRILLVCCLLQIRSVEGANILIYFGISTYSHRLAVWPLVEELSAHGHKVTFLSPFPAKVSHKNENVTEYVPQSLQIAIGKIIGKGSNLIKDRAEGPFMSIWFDAIRLGTETCEALMRDPEFVEWVKTSKFDLVIINQAHNDCANGVAHYQKIPFMIYGTTHPLMWLSDMMGIPVESSFVGDVAYGFPSENMNLFQRIYSTLSPLFWYYLKAYFMYPRLEKAINDGLELENEQKIDLQAMERQTSLFLSNTHFSLDHPRALPPIMVPIAGLHVKSKDVQELPKEMKKFVDESGDAGFMYISFGTGAQISKLEVGDQREFFYALGNSSNTRFLWKWENEEVPKEMPKNVFTSTWMPQSDILAHPKIKGFMTHGGFLSIIEATVFSVPLIVLPVFAEQDYNAERAESIGYGIKLEITKLKQAQIENAIHKILTEPKYKEKMVQVSKVFKDRQNSPLDTAMWWISYVLRHKSTSFLMSTARRQSWYVRRLVDVWLTLFGPIFLVAGLVLGYFLNNFVNNNTKRKNIVQKSIKTKKS